MRIYRGVIIACALNLLGLGVFAGEIHIGQLAEFESLADQLYLRAAGPLGGVLKTRRCVSYDRGDHIVMSPECILNNQLPELSFAEAVDLSLPYISQVDNFYEIEESEFYYEQAEVAFDEQYEKYLELLNNPNPLVLRLLAHREYLITVPKLYLALSQLDHYTFYASTRDVSSYGSCRRNNYVLALEQLDKTLLQPKESFNMNKEIAHLPGYCEGEGGKFMFYQGVCGGSTLAFWNALVNPNLYVTKRYNHNHRYAGFYGSDVLGDDASMYEMSKQFEFENIGEQPVYFRTITDDQGNITLLSIYPDQPTYISQVQKKQETDLSARLVNNVYHVSDGVLAYQQEWTSRYFGINNDTD